MFRLLYPTAYYDSVYSIDFEELYKKGYRGILTDVDNTLVGHGAPSDERAEAWFRHVHDLGFKTCIISNNGEARVRPFALKNDSLYVCDAHKPSKEGYIKGMEATGTNCENTIFLGDQLFTDILGANRAGLRSVLVKPLEKDPLLHIKLKRIGEKMIKPFINGHFKRHPGSF